MPDEQEQDGESMCVRVSVGPVTVDVDPNDERLMGREGKPDWAKIAQFIAQVAAIIAQIFGSNAARSGDGKPQGQAQGNRNQPPK